MQSKSKLDRIIFAERLVEAGLTLIENAKQFAHADFVRARAIRNGLMLALLTICPIRPKNFAALEIDKTFKQVRGRWWVTISATETKSRQQREERPIAVWLTPYINLYLDEVRPVLLTGAQQDMNALWISTKTRGPMTKRKVGSLITQITQETIGIPISPHLFRTIDATTAADARGDMPHLARALLGHTDPSITEEHYNRASSLSVGKDYAEILHKHYSAQT
jgi:site-specific recombinase XerD